MSISSGDGGVRRLLALRPRYSQSSSAYAGLKAAIEEEERVAMDDFSEDRGKD